MSAFDPVVGPARESFDLLTDPLDPNTFDEDFRRRRARFFDGRFLTARDLTREQDYTLTRQADLGQSGGGGVVSGLHVQLLGNARTLQIQTGYGVTPAGEVVRLLRPVTIEVGNLPSIQLLDATFGLAKLPGEPLGTSSGIFVLALRPVEFTDNPTISYPVGLDDRRRLEQGEIVEATALIMIPFKKTGQEVVNTESRADLAREIFFDQGLQQLSSEALPLAVVGLDRGNISFVDEFLVRRSIGSNVLGFGLKARSLREAFLRQYTAHLADVENGRLKAGQHEPYAATDFFNVLPPFGPLPSGSVEIRDQSILQSFFPPDMNVEITLVPTDELASIAEESLSFAPFDLTENTEAQELTAVMLLIPMDPEQYALKIAQFRSQARDQLEQRVNRPTARVLPIAALDALRRRRLGLPTVSAAPVDVAPWVDALKTAPRLFYVRRRQVRQVSFIVPRFQEVGGADPTQAWPAAIRGRLVAAGELAAGSLRRFDFLVRRAPTSPLNVVLALQTFFGLSVFDTSDATRREAALLVSSAVAELAYRARTRLEDLVRAETFPERPLLRRAPALPARLAEVHVRALRSEDVQALTALYDPTSPSSDPQFGQGLRRLLGFGDLTTPDFGLVKDVGAKLNLPNNRSILAASLRVRDLDRLIRSLPDPQTDPLGPRLAILAVRLLAFVEAANPDGIWALAANTPPPPLPGVI